MSDPLICETRSPIRKRSSQNLGRAFSATVRAGIHVKGRSTVPGTKCSPPLAALRNSKHLRRVLNPSSALPGKSCPSLLRLSGRPCRPAGKPDQEGAYRECGERRHFYQCRMQPPSSAKTVSLGANLQRTPAVGVDQFGKADPPSKEPARTRLWRT